MFKKTRPLFLLLLGIVTSLVSLVEGRNVPDHGPLEAANMSQLDTFVLLLSPPNLDSLARNGSISLLESTGAQSQQAALKHIATDGTTRDQAIEEQLESSD